MTSATPTERHVLAEQLDTLAGAYTFTSRLLLSAPDAGLLARTADPAVMDRWPLRDPVSRDGVRHLLRGSGPDRALEITRDHQRLFVGPGPLLAPPYESVHVTRERLLFEEPTMRVRAAYRAFGLAAPALNREPDDHIGLELHFLAQLCLRALDALDSGDEDTVDAVLTAQQAFLVEHLLVWAPACLADITTHARTDFYRGAALLTTGVLDEARAALVG